MSKGLESLERIYCHLPKIDGDRFKKDKEIIENALKNYEHLEKELCFVKTMEDLTIEAIKDKKLKALEIIKKKRLNLEYLKCCENYEQYKTLCSYFSEINRDEFDLLKEVLL